MTLIMIFGVGLLFFLSLACLAFLLNQNTTRLNRVEPDLEESANIKLSLGERQHLIELIQQGQKIQAIKEYRVLTRCSLKAAKHAIDRLGLDS